MSWVIQYFCTSCNLSFFIQPIEIADLETYVIICLLFPANIENNRHKWKFFEKEKVQYLLIGQKANYLLNKQSRAKIWYTHLHIWRNFRYTKHWICFHDFWLCLWYLLIYIRYIWGMRLLNKVSKMLSQY